MRHLYYLWRHHVERQNIILVVPLVIAMELVHPLETDVDVMNCAISIETAVMISTQHALQVIPHVQM